jgi:hypothetical protein
VQRAARGGQSVKWRAARGARRAARDRRAMSAAVAAPAPGPRSCPLWAHAADEQAAATRSAGEPCCAAVGGASTTQQAQADASIVRCPRPHPHPKRTRRPPGGRVRVLCRRPRLRQDEPARQRLLPRKGPAGPAGTVPGPSPSDAAAAVLFVRVLRRLTRADPPPPPKTAPRRAQPAEAPAPSGCVEYAFSRRDGAAGDERALAHLWELGGHEGPAAALARGGHVFLTFREVRGRAPRRAPAEARGTGGRVVRLRRPRPRSGLAGRARAARPTRVQVTSAVVVVALDLSDPASVLPCAEAWLAAVRGKLAATYAVTGGRGGRGRGRPRRTRRIAGERRLDRVLTLGPRAGRAARRRLSARG